LAHSRAALQFEILASWRTFLRAHWGAISGADFFTTEVWTWRGLVTYYTLFVIDLASRRVQIVGSTPHPEVFMRQVARTLTAADAEESLRHRVLICDRDRKMERAGAAVLGRRGGSCGADTVSGAERERACGAFCPIHQELLPSRGVICGHESQATFGTLRVSLLINAPYTR
jgi:hypothetical protein